MPVTVSSRHSILLGKNCSTSGTSFLIVRMMLANAEAHTVRDVNNIRSRSDSIMIMLTLRYYAHHRKLGSSTHTNLELLDVSPRFPKDSGDLRPKVTEDARE